MLEVRQGTYRPVLLKPEAFEGLLVQLLKHNAMNNLYNLFPTHFHNKWCI